MILDANLPVTSPILVTRGSTPTNGLDVREQNEVNTDCSATSGQTNTGPLVDTAEASEITVAPRRSRRVRKVPTFFCLGLSYVNYTDAGEPCTFDKA